jgi:hypothetical protein
MIYYAYDESLWREHPDGEMDIYLSGEWVPAVGEHSYSEEDLDHMQPVSEQDARRLAAEGF